MEFHLKINQFVTKSSLKWGFMWWQKKQLQAKSWNLKVVAFKNLFCFWNLTYSLTRLLVNKNDQNETVNILKLLVD